MTEVHPRAIPLKLLLDVARTSLNLVGAAAHATLPHETLEEVTAARTAWVAAEERWKAAVEAARRSGI
jgi:hypothetical protein